MSAIGCEASANEELAHELELAVSPGGGPALYLVSDGASVSSKPHRHHTWAVIAGIRGHQVNYLYRQQAGSQNTVARSSQIEVGPLSVLILNEKDINSTEVRGSGPTFHLHLYGRALHALPSFSSRSLLPMRSDPSIGRPPVGCACLWPASMSNA
jgi:predicted metal-dependent enzyme (double-stranded beta helix superfamily)